MTHGIQVQNSAGQTVFDSEHYCEFSAFTGTVQASTQGGTQYRLAVPDWCFGWDKAHITGTLAIQCGIGSGPGYNSRFEMSVSAVDGNGDLIFQPGRGDDISYNGAHIASAGTGLYGVTGTFPNFDYSNAYYIHTFSKDMTAIRNTPSSRTFTYYEVSTILPTVYARPAGFYVGEFWGGLVDTGGPVIITLVGGSYVYTDNPDYDSTSKVNRAAFIRDSVPGASQFEIIVAMPAYFWGGVTGTKAHTSGTESYGLFSGTTSDKQYTPNSPLTQFTTYDTRGRPSKAALTTTQEVPSSFSILNVSMGNLVSSSIKRWCRLNGTQFFKQDTSTGYPNYAWWGWTYNWSSNNNITLKFTSGGDRGTGYALTDSLASKHFFAVTDFGLGL